MKISNKISILVIVAVLVLTGCSKGQSRNTPIAASHPKDFILQDISWVDPYAYMVDLEHPDTVQYIADEQQYLAEQTALWDSNLNLMMAELNAQLSIEKKTTPIIAGDFEYHSEISKGQQYPIFYRLHRSLAAELQVVIDLNKLSNGADYYALGGFVTSPDEHTVAFTEDTSGGGNYTLRLRQLESGVVTTVATGVAPDLAWNGDAVLAVDKETNSVVAHLADGEKVIVYHESDPAFSLSVRTARDRKTVMITSESHRSTEIRVLMPDGELQLISAQGGRTSVSADDRWRSSNGAQQLSASGVCNCIDRKWRR